MYSKKRQDRYKRFLGTTNCPTLNDVFTRFKENVMRQTKPTKNHLDYIQRYEAYIGPMFGDRQLDQIFPSDMETLYKNTISEYSESQAFHVCNVIRYLYNRAIEWRMYMGDLPMGRDKSFSLKMPTKKRELVYTAEEVRAIMSRLKVRSLQTHDMVLLSFSTGARFGSVTNIKEKHVNLVDKTIKLVDMKDGNDMFVYLNDQCVEMIARRLTGNPNKYLFTSKSGGKVKELSKTFDRVIEAMGINEGVEDSRFKRKFHTLRHSFATHVLHNCEGITLGELKDLLGHSSLKTTERYIHANKTAMRKAAKSISAVL